MRSVSHVPKKGGYKLSKLKKEGGSRRSFLDHLQSLRTSGGYNAVCVLHLALSATWKCVATEAWSQSNSFFWIYTVMLFVAWGVYVLWELALHWRWQTSGRVSVHHTNLHDRGGVIRITTFSQTLRLYCSASEWTWGRPGLLDAQVATVHWFVKIIYWII